MSFTAKKFFKETDTVLCLLYKCTNKTLVLILLILLLYIAEVMDVQIEIVTDASVIVSWKRILNIPEITHYTVFYSKAGSRKKQADGEESRNVPNTEDSVLIRNLSGGARSYQFVVIAVATVDNVEIPGERSTYSATLPPFTPTSDRGMDYRVSCNIVSDGYLVYVDVCSGDVAIAVFVTIILHTIVMLVVCYIIYRVCYANKTK